MRFILVEGPFKTSSASAASEEPKKYNHKLNTNLLDNKLSSFDCAHKNSFQNKTELVKTMVLVEFKVCNINNYYRR